MIHEQEEAAVPPPSSCGRETTSRTQSGQGASRMPKRISSQRTMRGSSTLCVALALLGACRPASPALLLGASLSDAFQPARPLRCTPLIVASANVELGEGAIGGEKKFMGGPFTILYQVGPPWRQPRGKSMVSLVNSAARIGWHLWGVDLRFPSRLGRRRRRRCGEWAGT